MAPVEDSRVSAAFGRLSTGVKMLLILSLGLLPLGLIAVLASIESARENSVQRVERTLTRLDIKAARLDDLLVQTEESLRTVSASIARAPAGSAPCGDALTALSGAAGVPGRFAIFSNGALRCASAGFTPAPRSSGRGSTVEIAPGGDRLRLSAADGRGALEGVAEFDRAALVRLILLPGASPDFNLELWQGPRRMLLRAGYDPGPFARTVESVTTIAGGRLRLRIVLDAVPLRPSELLTILLPLLMAVYALVVGWIVLDRFVLRPLGRMQRAVSAYEPGDRTLALPRLRTPAREIATLGHEFERVTQTVARHESELEAAVDRQTRLVREVHHRVKNNLQVVASLLNLHARGAASDEVAAAYASIQRRVDALAVVHRNHFAELEVNRGVALKPLISELGANLRATAPAAAANMQIRVAIEPFYVTQDVAVSVAFLVTEIVEYAMFCGGHSVSVSLAANAGPGARLVIESKSLRGTAPCEASLTERFDRIVTGLSRQLRSTLDRDAEAGSYALTIAVLDRAE